jgi:hypothetical protein
LKYEGIVLAGTGHPSKCDKQKKEYCKSLHLTIGQYEMEDWQNFRINKGIATLRKLRPRFCLSLQLILLPYV